MALLREAQVLDRAQRSVALRKSTASVILSEARDLDEKFDVFLSHSSNEPEKILLGIKSYLEDEGLSVYVDRYTDPDLSPEHVTKRTAQTLRRRLNASGSLLYVHSRHSARSRWMPWELGYMDGAGRPVGIVPVAQQYRSAFSGEEYLGIYPYVDRAPPQGSDREIFWINRNSDNYAPLKSWLQQER